VSKRNRETSLQLAAEEGRRLAEMVEHAPEDVLKVITEPHFGWPSNYADPAQAKSISEAYDWIHEAMVLAYIRRRIEMYSMEWPEVING
jgi:hypothetical protein